MAEDSRTANVELTADVSNYSQGVTQAYKDTNLLIGSVNKLSSSLDGITKKIGKKLLLFSAADTAALAGMVALTARYERQLSTLRAQTEIANKSFKTYKEGITDLSKQLPKTRGELAQLVTQIEHLGVTSERETLKMARVFTNLSAATGDDVASLTAGMIELGRQMGTLAGGGDMMSKFSDSLVTVSASAGVAATSVVNFAQSISPFARAAGIGEAELLGISAAFTRAGADGYAAANTFNTMIADITRQVQSGSPEIAKYANVIGVTVEEFKNLTMTERITGIFDAVNKAGPNAIKILDRLGFDGIRAAKSIAAVSSEAGGLQKAIDTAVGAYGNGNTESGASVAFDTIDAKMSMLRNQIDILGSAIGEALLPPAKAFLNVLNNMATSVSAFLEPLLKTAGLMAAVMAPVTALAGTLTSVMGPLSSLMLVFMAARLTPFRALKEGFKEGASTAQGMRVPTSMGDRIRAMEAGGARVPFYQRWAYQLGDRIGGTQLGVGASRFAMPSLRALGTASADLVRTFTQGSRIWYQDAPLRGEAQWGRRAMLRGADNFVTGIENRARNLFGATRAALTDTEGQGMTKAFRSELEKSANAAKASTAAVAGNTRAFAVNSAGVAEETTVRAANSKGMLASAAAYMRNAGTITAFNTAMMNATRELLLFPLTVGKFGVLATAQIAGGIGKMIGSLFSGLGGMFGLGATGGAVLAGTGLALYGMKAGSDKSHEFDLNKESLTNLGPTNIALKEATTTLASFNYEAKKSSREISSLGQAARLSNTEVSAAVQGEYSDKRAGELNNDSDALAFLQSMGVMTPNQLRSLNMDLTKRFGYSRARNIVDQYLKNSDSGLSPMSGTSFGATVATPSNLSAVDNTDTGFVGYLRSIPILGDVVSKWSKDNASLEKVQRIWAGADTNAYEVGKKYGDKASGLTLANDQYQIMTDALGLLKLNQYPNGKLSAGAETTINKNLELFEGRYGNLGLSLDQSPLQPGLWTGPLTDTNSRQIKNANDFYKWMFSEKNQTEGAVAFRTDMEAQGITADDYLNGGKGITKKVIDAQRGGESAFNARMSATELGKFMLTNPMVKSVTEGTAVGNPASIRQATDAMVEEAIKSSKATGDLTSQFNHLLNQVGDTTDYFYQLAQAVKAEAQSRELFAAKNKGWDAEFLKRWDQIAQELESPTLQDDQKKALVEERRSMMDQQRGNMAQYVLALEQFAISQERAQKSHDKSVQRAIEDAAQGWQNAYQRSANQQQITSSPGLIGINLEEQQATLKGQVSSLKKLKSMGLSEDAIAMLQLTDPNMGNQAIRLGAQATKGDIQLYNELAAEREKAVKTLETQFSRPFKRAEEDFTIATNQAIEDMQRMGRIARGDIDQLYARAVRIATALGIALPEGVVIEKNLLDDRRQKNRQRREEGEEYRANYAWGQRYAQYAAENPERGGTSNRKVGGGGAQHNGGGSWGPDDVETGTLKFRSNPNDNPWGVNPDKVPWLNGDTEKPDWRSENSNAKTAPYATPTTSNVTNNSTTNSTTNYNLSGDIIADDPAKLVGELRRRAALNNLKTGGQATNPASV